MLQVTIIFILFIFLIGIIGKYLYYVAQKKKMKSDYFFDKLDKAIFKILKLNKKNMNWKEYSLALFLSNFIMMILAYVILRLQNLIFFNPNNIKDLSADLSFNTIISFMTNTNLQHYSGETALSYFSQMVVITMMMFTSAATGYSACKAMIRALCGKKMGNYFVDMTRVITRVLIPLSLVVGMILVSQGTPQTLDPNITVNTIEGKLQDIPLGPIASLESIKHIGTNGGGFLGANSSTPFENPNIITNMVEMFSMMILPGSCVIVFGLTFFNEKNKRTGIIRRKRTLFGDEGRSIFIAMSLIFVMGLLICFYSESAGNPELGKLGINQSMGNYEGKEVRFGIAQSSMFSTVTTAFTTGTVNNMHDTLTPLGGMVPLLNMMINTVFGGVGVGLMNMLLYVMLTVFICGLMIGRTPEYLGKKIESREMRLIVICILLHPVLILGFSAIAVSVNSGLAGITNPGYHGLSQVLYEFSSSAANNGSGFEGLSDNNFFWNITTGLAMFFGRYISIILQLAIAGSLLSKRYVNETSGTLKTSTVSFGIITSFIVIIFAALTFLPAVSLGPIAEHLVLWR